MTLQTRTVFFSCVLSLVMFGGINSADALIIDTFDTGTFSETLLSNGDTFGPTTQALAEPDVIEGDRTRSGTKTAGSGTMILSVDGGSLNYTDGFTSGSNGFASILWDNGGANFDRDFTDLGSSDSFNINVITGTSIGFGLEIRVADLDNSITLPVTINTLGSNIVLFEDFGPTIDFVHLTEVELIIPEGGTQENLFIDFFQSQAAVPEPSSIALLGMGAFGLLGYGWRRKKKAIVEEAA